MKKWRLLTPAAVTSAPIPNQRISVSPDDRMIDVQQITKRYGQHTAIDRVTFSVGKADVLGFQGPNGAGTTPTMRILTCFMPATEGKATVAGYDCLEHPLEVKRRIGYLPETPPVYLELTVEDYLRFVGRLRGLTGALLTTAMSR